MDERNTAKPPDKLPRCIGTRVDYLQVAFRVDFHPETLRALRNRAAAAKDLGGGAAELIVGKLVAQLRAPRDESAPIRFKNHDVLGEFNLRGAGGWTLEFRVRAVYLATHAIEDTVRMLEEIAVSLGKVEGRRLRRIDLAADFVDFPLELSMSGDFSAPRRGKLGQFEPENKDVFPERRAYVQAGKVTGFVVCPGNELMARVYDKTAELAAIRDEEKTAIEHSRWTVAQWTADESVTRVEFQLRGVALDELDLRDPSARRLAERVDPIWQYLTRKWLRMIEHDDERVTRCSTTERWSVVQTVVFRHATTKLADRTRRRGGASYEQAFGSMLSALAGVGFLPRALRPVGESESNATREMTRDQQDGYLRSLVLDVSVTFGMRLADHMQRVHGIEDSPAIARTKINAAWSRFYAIGDVDMPGRWTVDPMPDGDWRLSFADTAASAALGDLLDEERKALQSEGA